MSKIETLMRELSLDDDLIADTLACIGRDAAKERWSRPAAVLFGNGDGNGFGDGDG